MQNSNSGTTLSDELKDPVCGSDSFRQFLVRFLPRDALVHSAVLRLHVVRLSVRPSVHLSVCRSVTLVDQDNMG